MNPGIAYTVKTLREWGFDTTDSGDGQTHDHECDLPVPYVYISVPRPERLSHMMAYLRTKLYIAGVTLITDTGAADAPMMEGSILADMSAWIHLFNVIIPEPT